MSQHRHFSTSFLAEVGLLSESSNSGIGSNLSDPMKEAEGSTKSDPLPSMGVHENKPSGAEVSKGLQKEIQQTHGESFLSVRQRQRNAAAAAICIPGELIQVAIRTTEML